MTSSCSLVSVCFVLTFLVSLTRGEGFVPENFTTSNLTQYTIRYLSEDGNDTDSCLSGQAYPPDPWTNTIQYCGSLIYTLTGGHHFRSQNINNVIVLVLPGSYPMGEKGIEILNSQNIILSKMPGTPGEVVFRCNDFLEESYNNLFINSTGNLTLNGIIFTECGSYASPVRLRNTTNTTVSDCTFRYPIYMHACI